MFQFHSFCDVIVLGQNIYILFKIWIKSKTIHETLFSLFLKYLFSSLINFMILEFKNKISLFKIYIESIKFYKTLFSKF